MDGSYGILGFQQLLLGSPSSVEDRWLLERFYKTGLAVGLLKHFIGKNSLLLFFFLWICVAIEEWILFAIINLPDLHNQLDAWGINGEVIQVKMPSKDEVSKLVSTSEKQYNIQMESARCIPDLEKVSGQKGIVKLSRTPIELKSSVWNLKVVPGVGGRIISMEHLPSGFRISHGEVVLGSRSEGLKLDSKLVLHQPRQS